MDADRADVDRADVDRVDEAAATASAADAKPPWSPRPSGASGASGASDRAGRARPGFVLAAASIGYGVVQLDVSVVNVAIKPIGAALGGGIAGLQWVVDAYTVPLATLILTAGALGDRFGARRLVVAGVALFVAASAGCGAALDMAGLIAARAVQGVGAAVLAGCSLSLLAHAHPEARARARAVGLWAAGASVSLVAGPVVGGLLITAVGWRSVFFINVPIGLTGIWLTLRHAEPSPRSPDRSLDPWGQISAVAALTGLAVATIQAGAHGMDDPVVLVGFAVALVAGSGFAAVEVRGAGPMLPLRLLGSAPFGIPVAIGLLVNVAFYGMIFELSLFFQQARHASALWTGLAFAPMMAAVTAANLTATRLTGRIGARGVLLTGALLLAGGYAAMLGTGAGTSFGVLAGPLVAEGYGLGIIVPVMTSILLGSVDGSRSGLASGALGAARQTGSVAGVALFGSLAAVWGAVDGLRVALLVSIGLIALLAVLAVRIGHGTGT